MRPIIDIHLHARNDIRSISVTDKKAAMAILALLEQASADPNILDKLTTRGSNDVGTARLGVKRWESMKRKGNLWRFRLFDTPATVYRVIYGYYWPTQQIHVLAVVRKEEFDYDDHNSDIVRRITNDWVSLES